MVPGIGDEFGPYRILGPLGSGGMGMVFRAQDMRLHREVAIKVLADHLNVPEMKERFLREARAASALNHPNICTLFDIGQQNGTPYLVMELLHGDTIKHLAAGNPMAPDLIAKYGAQAADALSAAHARGVIHRDIKSANVFVVHQDHGEAQVKILDFGLAKMDSGDTMVTSSGQLMATSLDQGLTSPGSTVGTVAYMSPEQAKGEQLDPRTDIFSFGAVLYEMATGTLPFPGATSALVFVGLLSRDPLAIRAMVPGFPPELERIVLKCLQKERGDRYQTARDLRQDLLRLATRESGSHAAAPVEQKSEPPVVAAAPVIAPVIETMQPLIDEPASAISQGVESSRSDFMRSGLSKPAEPQTSRTRMQQKQSPFVHEEDLASMVNVPVARVPGQTSSGSVSIPSPARPRPAGAPARQAKPATRRAARVEPPEKSGGHGGLIAAVVILLLLVGGFAAYHFMTKPSGTADTPATPEPPAAGAGTATADATITQVHALLNQGQLTRALRAAQALAAKEPKSADALALEQQSLARLDRFEAARQVYQSAAGTDTAKSGKVRAEELIVSRLLNDSAGEAAQAAAVSAPDGYQVAIARGYALQDSGQLAAAASAWQDGARRATQAGDHEAAAGALAANALANALAGNCATVGGQASAATGMQPTARALAKAGVALGLCRNSDAADVVDALQKQQATDPLVKALYLPEIHAAQALGNNDGATALSALNGVAQYDLGSLAPYLRGLADLQSRQPKLAVGDFQAVINHRGAFVAGRLLCYPMALSQLAKTYTLMGDKMNADKITQRAKNY